MISQADWFFSERKFKQKIIQNKNILLIPWIGGGMSFKKSWFTGHFHILQTTNTICQNAYHPKNRQPKSNSTRFVFNHKL